MQASKPTTQQPCLTGSVMAITLTVSSDFLNHGFKDVYSFNPLWGIEGSKTVNNKITDAVHLYNMSENTERDVW